jgi:pyruvate-formate lyase-activating enzyme
MNPKLLIADSKNRIFDVDGAVAAGMKAGNFYPLDASQLIPLPFASELFVLTDRIAIGTGQVPTRQHFFEEPVPTVHSQLQVKYNPFSKNKERCFPVAAFLSPGYTATFNAAYAEDRNAKLLPLFSYAAVSWYKGGFYAAAVRIDRERRQDLRFMDMCSMRANAARFRKAYPKNRLVQHLCACACEYSCPAAINFFLERYEAPLPTSGTCNSLCFGCISVKHSPTCPAVQPRIRFLPTPQEIAQVALHHIGAVRKPVVSFGQGCEGEPLLVWDVLEKAIRLIRQSTKRGVINLNTNASRPQAIKRLRLAGLDSMRVSLNSVRRIFYNAYYKPLDYGFADVLSSIKMMKSLGGFVSINYLVMPGFTDERDEASALFGFIKDTKIDMIQWRNLNYDPLDYFRKLHILKTDPARLMGVGQLITEVKKRFPRLRHGYFNPSVI